MLQQSTISPGAARKPSMDFLHLREEALEVVRQLAGEVWTDHNLHDPGITILEQLCYALTDLGYRLNFSVPDLLADALDAEQVGIGWKSGLDRGESPTLPGMPGLEAVLPAAPTTYTDWQGLILDIDDVRSAQINAVKAASPSLFFHDKDNELLVRQNPDDNLVGISIQGLHEIHVDADQGRFRPVSQRIQGAFHAQRPAGEDLHRLVQLLPAPIALVAELDLERGVSPEETVAEIFLRVDQYLSPQVRYKTREDLRAQGWRMDQVMEGPLLQGGVLKYEDLHDIAPKKVLYLSRIIEQVFAVQGVLEVRSLRLKGEHAQVSHDEGVSYWVPMLSEGMVPTLDPETALITVRVDGMAMTLDSDKVRARYLERRQLLKARQTTGKALTLPRNRQVAAYQSVQHQFPDNYGVNSRGLPIGTSVTRQAQAHQLKTWLLFFEQILTNYFSKAGHLGHMFQMSLADDGLFPQGALADVPSVQASFLSLTEQARQLEDAGALKALKRFERLLGHLLARFGQDVKHFANEQEAIQTEYQRLQTRVQKMLAIYRELPTITKGRGQGANVLGNGPGLGSTGGLKVRIAALLGLRPDDPDLDRYSSLAAATAEVDFVMVEHILLRPIPREYDQENMLFRFRNGKIHKIVRLRSRTAPYTYRFKCYASGTEALIWQSIPEEKLHEVTHDRVEIVFTTGQRKLDFDVVAADAESFTIVVDETLANVGGNPQGGCWNKLKDDEQKLHVDPWSLQLTFVFPRHDARFAQVQQRHLVEKILREESPAHLAVNVLWLDTMDMQAFCNHYYHWRQLHAQYLQHNIEAARPDERYVRLRHHRNHLMRHLFVGETDPVRDLRLLLLPTEGITGRIGLAGELIVEVPVASKADLIFELPEVEPGILYSFVDPVLAVTEGQPYAPLPTAQVGTEESLQFTLAATDYPAGESQWAIYAFDPSIQTGNFLHQRITILVS
jgi:hypothetical protein